MQGWDPDTRQGFGAASQVSAAPLKAVMKSDTAGVGVVRNRGSLVSKPKPRRLGAKQVRSMEVQWRHERKHLEEIFYASEDTLRHLRSAS